jgi:hypothetical protein
MSLKEGYLPLGLAHNVKLKRDIADDTGRKQNICDGRHAQFQGEQAYVLEGIAETEAAGRNAEAGRVDRKSNVAGHRKAHAATVTKSVDEGDDGLAECGETFVGVRDCAVVLGDGFLTRTLLAELRDVGAGAERRVASAGQRDHADGGIGGGFGAVAREVLPHPERHGVAARHVVDGEAQNAVAQFGGDPCVAHAGRLPIISS